jgi:hypothetical protein
MYLTLNLKKCANCTFYSILSDDKKHFLDDGICTIDKSVKLENDWCNQFNIDQNILQELYLYDQQRSSKCSK